MPHGSRSRSGYRFLPSMLSHNLSRSGPYDHETSPPRDRVKKAVKNSSGILAISSEYL